LAQPQETFAEAALFSEAYHCNAVATENTIVIKINKRLVLEHAGKHPAYTIHLRND